MADTASKTQWVYDFADGSRDMRELLGGKGANVAEMTRVLGADKVPAGFTITTEACVAYMKAGQEEPEGMPEQVEEALERLSSIARELAYNDYQGSRSARGERQDRNVILPTERPPTP